MPVVVYSDRDNFLERLDRTLMPYHFYLLLRTGTTLLTTIMWWMRMHLKGDERILGDSEFVESVLEAASEKMERGYRLRAIAL